MTLDQHVGDGRSFLMATFSRRQHGFESRWDCGLAVTVFLG